MFTAPIALVITVSALVMILLVVVVAAIRREPPAAELSSRAPSVMAGMVRRLLGVSVRRPTRAAEDERRDVCLAGYKPGHGAEGEGR
jgi:hypothetical protein